MIEQSGVKLNGYCTSLHIEIHPHFVKANKPDVGRKSTINSPSVLYISLAGDALYTQSNFVHYNLAAKSE